MIKRVVKLDGLTRKRRDLLQVRAFQAFYKVDDSVSPDQRFVNALCKTSDDAFENIIDWTLVEKWLEQISKEANGKKSKT